MVSRMADVNADAAVVGFYTSTNNGQVLATGGFVEALVGAQLSGAGVGSGSKAQPVARAGLGARPQTQLASGEANKAAKGIALVYGASLAFLSGACAVEYGAHSDSVRTDIASATQGAVGLKAYRLSQAFIDAYRSGKFDTARCASLSLCLSLWATRSTT